VQRTEVVRVAQQAARQTMEDAESEARRLQHEAEDFCDHRLAQFEVVLTRTLQTVSAGRRRLSAPPLPPGEPGSDLATTAEAVTDDRPRPAFFDQDQR
nr:hypothetical protein [Acidimicrobiia bacterium]